MKVKLLFIGFILIAFSLNAQNVCTIDIEIMVNHEQPLANKNLYLYNSNAKLSWSYSDEKGKASFLIDSIPLNSDAVYFLIKTEDSLSSNIKIFINELRLLENNRIGNYYIKITDFKLFSLEEYIKYSKKNELMPLRKKF